MRTLFVVEPVREDEVRERIRAALVAGRLAGAGAEASGRRLRRSGPPAVRPDEADHARRLATG